MKTSPYFLTLPAETIWPSLRDRTEPVNLFCRRSKGRAIRLEVIDRRQLRLSLPKSVSLERAKTFLLQQENCLLRALDRALEPQQELSLDERRVLRRLCLERAQQFLEKYEGKKPKQLIIRHQRTRWGSCSARGTISLNLCAARLDDSLFEYLMIHELCHLYELNHSSKFWARVEAHLPDYRERRQKLKQIPLC